MLEGLQESYLELQRGYKASFKMVKARNQTTCFDLLHKPELSLLIATASLQLEV